MPRRDLVDIRGGTRAEWEATDPVLAENEIAVIEDERLLVIGDGVTAFSGLVPIGSGTYVGSDELWVPAHAFTVAAGAPSLTAANGTSDGWPTWLLDASSTESVGAHIVGGDGPGLVPDSWTTLDVDLWWMNAGAGSGDVVWRLDNRVRGDGDSLGAGYAFPTATLTAGSQNAVKVSVDAWTGLTAPTSSQALGLRLTRTGGSASDTLANDVGFLGLRLKKAS